MQPTPDSKAWMVIFFDGNDGVSHIHAFTHDSDMAAIETWAKDQIAADKAVFAKNPDNKSLAQRYVVYGVQVDRLHLLRETRRS
jgi:hypothetical protein